MGKHYNNRTHPAGADRATVNAIASRADRLNTPTIPMPVTVDPPPPDQPDEWVTADDWDRQHCGPVTR